MKQFRSPFSIRGLTWCCGLGFAATHSLGAAGLPPPDPARVAQIARLLSATPPGFGARIDDRQSWQRLAQHPAYAKVVEAGEKALAQPFPEQPDDLYLEFSRNGNRTHWQKVAGERRGRVRTYALAECVENQGRFLAPLAEAIAAIAAEPTWVMPAHDTSLANFKGTTIDLDLGS